MPQIINSNIPSLNSQRNLNRSQGDLAVSLQRLSSGLRINSAKDDAAGMAISERMTAQVRGLNQASRNAADAISLSQTAEGALQSTSDILNRMRELAVQAVNGTNSGSDRQALNAEISQLVSELDRIAASTEFNGLKLLNGSFGSQSFQVGANAYQTITVGGADTRTNKFGLHTLASEAIPPAAGAAFTAGLVDISGLTTKQINVVATDSAKEIADKVNGVSAETNVSAMARTMATLDFAATGAYSIDITAKNTTPVTVSFNISNIDSAEGLAQAVNEINKVASQTGVTAKLDESATEIRLENNDGTTINIANGAGSVGAISLATGRILNDGTYSASAPVAVGAATNVDILGYLSLDSASGFSVTSASNAFLTNPSDSTNMVSTVSVTTADKATMALRIVDAALTTVNNIRANYGAIQSRFETTIVNLQTTSENLAASRSRIRDADFASETAALARAQILQQAGTAMLAQANTIPQNVLSLLQR